MDDESLPSSISNVPEYRDDKTVIYVVGDKTVINVISSPEVDGKSPGKVEEECQKNCTSSNKNLSKDNVNWVTVGEIIRIIKEPVALYTGQIIKEWHMQLCSDLPGQCSSPDSCKTKKKPNDLCSFCKKWYDELAKCHQKDDEGQFTSTWEENCDATSWPKDPWEVAKFFMPVLGDKRVTIKDVDSTDLSSLLDVLSRMEDAAFVSGKHLDCHLVEELCSKVRNPWTLAAKRELADTFLNDAFDIVSNFATELEKVFSCDVVKKCIEDISDLKYNEMNNVTKEEYDSFLLVELGANVTQMNDSKSLARQVINNQEEHLETLFSQPSDRQPQLKSCTPVKPETFIGRDAKVREIITSLVKNSCGIVSIVGGPGFGKSTVAVEVSHHLINEHDIVVIFSFLSHASTVPEVITCLCHDVGVIPGKDPKSSLMLWLKSIERKVVLVMDNIEQLLEKGVKSKFIELVRNLRKNSQQHLHILTTTRTEFSVSGQTIENHKIGELDEIASVELLKKCCPTQVENADLSELAKLCGFVPLALCIAGTVIPDLDHPSEMIEWLREKPMEALRSPDQCVHQAIEFSFQKLSDEDQKSLVCLSVFNGDFERSSAKEVIQRNRFKTPAFLRNLVSRSLLQVSSDKRFVVHSLIRRFLDDHEQFQDKKAMAQELMVKHFLKECHSWTLDCYSYDGFTRARESLKKDVHNVEETFKICSQCLNSNIHELLASSDIYKFSYRFFHNFSWDLLSEAILRNFFVSCTKLAQSRDQPATEIIFQCLVAAEEGRRSAWKSAEYIKQIKDIEKAFHKNKAVLKEDRFVFMFCYQLLARYYLNEVPDSVPTDFTEDDLPSLPENTILGPMEKVTEAYILMRRGSLIKMRANKMAYDKEKKKELLNCADLFYNQSITLAKEVLGDHELTCALYKHLGDLCFNCHRNDEALSYYTDAINLHKKLKLDSNEQFVMLLKNFGACLLFLRRFDESVETLKEACDIADKIENTRCRAQVYCQLARTYSKMKPDSQEAAFFAKEAMKMQKLLYQRDVKSMVNIIERAEKYVEIESIIKPVIDIINVEGNCQQSRLKSCIPNRPQIFIGREAEVKEIISALVENDCGIVSIVGGPGFGKTAVAIEVSYHLSNEHDIAVIFSSLSNASNVSQVRQRLCHDIGLNPGKDPGAPLMFWLKNIKTKVVLVMDNVEQLVESDVKSQFHELLLTLRRNSHHHLHILTTTRTELVIPEQPPVNYLMKKLDENSSIELLKKCCPKEDVEDAYFPELTELCGFVPLALSIAGAIILDHNDLLEIKSNHNLRLIIEVSFQKLCEKDRKALVCLSVFDGNFETNSAKEVIERSEAETLELLVYLVSRGFIQDVNDQRFVIHSFIRRFLSFQDQFRDEKIGAQELMVRYFLKLCHSLTMECFSYDGYTRARDALKKDVHNIEETLRICTQNETTSLNPNILDLLVCSDIYKSMCRFFHRITWDLVSGMVSRNFFEACIKLAEDRGQPVIAITFQCLVADQEGHRSAWKSPEYFERLDGIAVALHESHIVQKEDRFFLMFCYSIFPRFDSDKAKYTAPPDLPEDVNSTLHENVLESPIAKAAEVYFLMERRNLKKKLVSNEDKKRNSEYMNSVELFYNQAFSLAKDHFGDHELTCVLQKLLGDLYLNSRKNKEAMKYYSDALLLRKKLKLDSIEPFAFLLKNCGMCLSYLGRFDESVATLKKARDIAGKNTYCRAMVNFALAKTHQNRKSDCQEAIGYAKEALEMQKLLDPHKVKGLESIRQGEEKIRRDNLDQSSSSNR
ncbi:uncharacterized protein LOC114520812 [Dendronephthya gigantea]|uniref:uncharacterized protein LOC114520812 n=1 Tax=Dendronephthya gigantea TaxID=151771 RepID=UPI001069581B|nr:uncharacterized protein LOC114520812 [Dendronephthya gigantea]